MTANNIRQPFINAALERLLRRPFFRIRRPALMHGVIRISQPCDHLAEKTAFGIVSFAVGLENVQLNGRDGHRDERSHELEISWGPEMLPLKVVDGPEEMFGRLTEARAPKPPRDRMPLRQLVRDLKRRLLDNL